MGQERLDVLLAGVVLGEHALDPPVRLSRNRVRRLDVRPERGLDPDLHEVGVGVGEEDHARRGEVEEDADHDQHRERAGEQARPVVGEQERLPVAEDGLANKPADHDERRQPEERADDLDPLQRPQVEPAGEHEEEDEHAEHARHDRPGLDRRAAPEQDALDRVDDDPDEAYREQDAGGDEQQHPRRPAHAPEHQPADEEDEPEREAPEHERVAEHRPLGGVVALEHPPEEGAVARRPPRHRLVLEPLRDGVERKLIQRPQERDSDEEENERLPVDEQQDERREDDQPGGDQPRPAAPLGLLLAVEPDEVARDDRVDDEGNEEARRQRHDERQRHVAHEPPDDARPQEHRRERRDGRRRGRRDGEADLAGAEPRRLPPAVALLAVAVDVLDDHDRVVDEHPERDDEAEQDDEVQRLPHRREDQEAQKHRERNRDPDERRRPHPEEEEQHRDDEDQPGDDVVLEVLDEGLDVFGLVAGVGHLGPVRKRKLGDGLAHRGDGLDDVLAGALGDAQADDVEVLRRGVLDVLPVLDLGLENRQPGVRVAVLEPHPRLGDVADVDRLPARRVEHEALDLLGAVELAVDADEIVQPVYIDRAAGDVRVLALDRGDEVVEREVVALERGKVHIYLHLAREPADEVHVEHAGGRLDLVLQVLGDVAELRERVARGEVDVDDRELARVELGDDRLLDLGRPLDARAVHGLADVELGVVHVHVRRELDHNGGYALGRGAPQVVDAVDRRDLALDLLRDDRLDVVGARAGVDGRHDNRRELDLRGGLLRDRDVGDEAGDDEQAGQHDHGNAVVNGEIRDFHDAGELGRSVGGGAW